MSVNVHKPRRTDRRNTQRERLIAGMIAAAHEHGYAGATVSHVIGHAGVSRPTFYEYFTDKDDCFLATHRELNRLLISEIRGAVSDAGPEQAVQAAIRTLIELSEAHPGRAGFLANEAMAAGSRGLDERDLLVEEIARAVEDVRSEAPPDALTPDLPIEVVVGAGRWLLAPALRRGERDLTPLAEDIVRWVEMYRAPAGDHRWHTLEPGPDLPRSPHIAEMSLSPPPAIPPGRSRLSKSEIARNQRERILYATAEQAVAKGYNLTTVADITATAKIDRRVFYKHFRDKQQAFLAVHELAIQQLMALAAGAFFSTGSWPERVWAAIRAGTQFHANNPIVTHLALVESHAVGTSAIQRIDDSRAAFTIFLQEGNLRADHTTSRRVTEAIGGSVFEICYRVARRGEDSHTSRFTGNSAYIVLAPFIGPEAANEFIDEKLREATVGLDVRR